MTTGRHATVGAVAGTNPVVLVGWPTPALYSAGDADADVLARVLESRAVGRTATSAILDVAARQDSTPHGSYLLFRIEGTPGSTPQSLLDEFDAVLAGIAKGELEEIAVRVAAKRQVLALRRRLGSLQGRAETIAGYIAAGKPADWIGADAQRYRRTSRTTVAHFVASTLIGRPRGVVFVSPTATASTEAP